MRRCARPSTGRGEQADAPRPLPADQHRDGDGLAERAAEAEHRGSDDAREGAAEDDLAHDLPVGRAHPVGGVDLVAGVCAITSRVIAVMMGRIMIASTLPAMK
jgi:hypothetical protein